MRASVHADGSIFRVYTDGEFDMANKTVFFRPFKRHSAATTYVYSVLGVPVNRTLDPVGVPGDYARLDLSGWFASAAGHCC